MTSKLTLNKYLSQAGFCSRRKATELIKDNKVTLNGKIENLPYTVVNPKDLVMVEGKAVKLENKIYILLNKPKGVVCTLTDSKDRKTVADIFKNEIKERLYPIGRLDRNTTGLIIMTNDGELTQRLSHPKYEVTKVYTIKSKNLISKKEIETLMNGVDLEDGFMKIDEFYYPEESKKTVCIAIHSGKKHIVRRMLQYVGHPDIILDRSNYAGLTKKGLRPGFWRYITKHEIAQLSKNGSVNS